MSDPNQPDNENEGNALDPHPFLPSQAYTSDDPEKELEEATAELVEEDRSESSSES